MAVWFYPGQEDYITKLNELGAIAELTTGANGWTPVFAAVQDGTRVVLKVVDWTGGTVNKPAINQYLTNSGLTPDIALATDIRGAQGLQGEAGNDGLDGEQGPAGPANTLTVGTVVSSVTPTATITGTSPNQVLNLELPKGDKGDTGNTGPANTLTVGTVTSGGVADATITGTSPNQVLNLVLPKGDKGDTGLNGTDGLAATIAIGTVTTGAPGSSASVVNSGTSNEAVLDFTIPRGEDGSGAGDVLGPAASVDNEVVLFDGATGKVIKGGGVLGTAAFSSASSFATATQGTKADTAVQPGSLGTASTRNVAATGDASTTQVVLGSDTRLTNARPASDVSAWAKAATKPSYTKSEVGLSNVDNTSDASKSVLSATKLTTARTINGVSFDGSANISVPVDWSSVTGKPAVIAAGADAAAARSAIGAGTSNLTLGTTAGTALAGNTTLLPEAPSDGKTYGRKNANWAEVAAGDSTPPGTVIFYAKNSPPTGYLKANGAVVSRTTYAALFAAIGTTFGAGDGSTTFALPDLRGQFVRGWVDNGTVDSGRAFGSGQAHAYLNHAHTAFGSTGTTGAHTHTFNPGTAMYSGTSGSSNGVSSMGGSTTTSSAGDHTHTVTVTVDNSTTGSTETRPVNVALLACIKF